MAALIVPAVFSDSLCHRCQLLQWQVFLFSTGLRGNDSVRKAILTVPSLREMAGFAA
jgi:hypothetical protein